MNGINFQYKESKRCFVVNLPSNGRNAVNIPLIGRQVQVHGVFADNVNKVVTYTVRKFKLGKQRLVWRCS